MQKCAELQKERPPSAGLKSPPQNLQASRERRKCGRLVPRVAPVRRKEAIPKGSCAGKQALALRVIYFRGIEDSVPATRARSGFTQRL